jgi:hypothetical protein
MMAMVMDVIQYGGGLYYWKVLMLDVRDDMKMQ